VGGGEAEKDRRSREGDEDGLGLDSYIITRVLLALTSFCLILLFVIKRSGSVAEETETDRN